VVLDRNVGQLQPHEALMPTVSTKDYQGVRRAVKGSKNTVRNTVQSSRSSRTSKYHSATESARGTECNTETKLGRRANTYISSPKECVGQASPSYTYTLCTFQPCFCQQMYAAG